MRIWSFQYDDKLIWIDGINQFFFQQNMTNFSYNLPNTRRKTQLNVDFW